MITNKIAEMIAKTMAEPPMTGTDLFRAFFAQIAGNQNRNTHGKLNDYEGHQIKHLASGGYCRKT